jgi:hypothetical protein
MKVECAAAAMLLTSVSGTGALAGTELALTPVDRGGYFSSGFHSAGVVSYAVGNFVSSPQELRNFFVYDLSGVNGTIVAAELRIQFRVYSSNDPFETFALHDFTSPIGSLLNATGGVAAFEDLGDGELYGSHDFSKATELDLVPIALSNAALSDMNSTTGLWAMGGRVTTLDDDFFGTQEVLSSSSAQLSDLASTQLILTIEIPAPGVLALLGAAGVCGRGRRRRS